MPQPTSVAVVGIGGIFPGARDLDQFWTNIVQGVDSAREVPDGRWVVPPGDAYDPGIAVADKVYSKRGCFIEELPRKSTMGLDISPDVLSGLDGMFHLLLHAGHQAFRDGVTADLDRSRVGVIIGNVVLPTEEASALAQEYLGRSLEEKVLGQSRIGGAPTTNPLNRYVAGLPAGVLAKALGLGGGSFALDAACASSLYALKLAVDELEAGRADAMLTGGLSRPDCLYTQMGFSQLRALSPSGVCSPFDAKGDGLVVGEGAGMLLLKRTEDALRDGDTIYAVIRGIGLSNDIGGGLLAPMPEGQLRAMRAAYDQAGWRPQEVGLIECHATGTPVGDAVEVESLRTLWGADQWELDQCVLGSVKSNIGHLLTAAGSAALIKTLLAFKEKTLPPTANFSTPAPSFGLEESPFQVLTNAKPWPKPEGAIPRRAAVSAFGFGGINAHVLLEEWVPADDQPLPIEVSGRGSETSERQDHGKGVAVVGMDAHFGPWTSLRAFQERVLGGGFDAEPASPRHWWGAEDSAWFKLQGLSGFPFKGHYIHELAISPEQFRIPPKELEEMLPQQLLMLQVAAGALTDAGIERAEAENGRQGERRVATGVFIGLGLDLNTTNYSFRWSMPRNGRDWAKRLGLQLSPEEMEEWVESLREASGPALTANRTMGALGSVVASRIAREFRFGGPSFTLSSEESSGVRALEIAYRAIRDGSLDRAVVGAVDLAGDVRAVLAAHRGRAFSASATPRPFDERADGALVGEGAAAVVLKREEDAIRDGDRIYALVRGIGAASGGGVESQVPLENAYLKALERAYGDAGIGQHSVGYIESHGSGCPEEDRMEARALAKFFKVGDGSHLTLLGSAKADVGHTGSASGLASFVKACLCLYQEILPPLRNHSETLAELAAAERRLHPAQHPQHWLRDRVEGPLRAGVSSFSVDGNCTHVVLESCEHELESAARTERLQPLGVRQEGLFVIEANNVPALTVGLSRLRAHIEHTPDKNIEFLARQWWAMNREDPQKSLGLALVARNGAELLDQVEFVSSVLAHEPDRRLGAGERGKIPPFVYDRVFFSPDPVGVDGKVAFVFPGSGNQYAGMGRELSVHWPETHRKQDSENDYLRSQYQPELFWNSDSVQAVNQDHKAALFGQVALGTAVSDLIQSFGVRPHAVVGYSLGEMAGLFALKAWTARDVMLKRINASTLFTEDLAGDCNAARRAWKLPSNKTVEWVLGVIDRPAKVARAALKDHKKVYSLIANTLHECVVGGDRHAVEKLVKKLDCEFFPLQGVTTVHCEVAKEVQEPYRELHLLETTPPKDIRFYSSAWGTAYNVSRESAADSVLAQAIYGIDYPKVIETAYEEGVRVFLEMGPGASCTRMIGEILKDRPHVAKSACHQGQYAVSAVLRLLGHLVAERVPVDLSVLYGQETAVLEHREEAPTPPLITVPIGGKPFNVVLPEWQTPEGGEAKHAAEAETLPPLETDGPLRPLETEVPVRPLETAAMAAAPLRAVEEPIGPVSGAVSGAEMVAFIRRAEALEASRAEAHETYLRFSESAAKALTEAVSFQMTLLESMMGSGKAVGKLTAPPVPLAAKPSSPNGPAAPAVPLAAKPSSPNGPAGLHANLPALQENSPPFLDRDACLEFAVGSIAKVLGPDFAEVDAHPTRVRLPDEPLMLVDRILSIQGEPRSMSSGRMTTEHDIHPGAWYLDGGRIPTCIAVEAGQADLFLSSYLGIDFHTKGLAVYRLLDAVATFHRSLPGPGETIHYDIRIEHFFRQGDTYLCRFNFDATVNGEPLLTMRDGCAGFFTEEELASGQGVIQTKLDLQPMPGVKPADWEDFVPMVRESYSDDQVNALRSGDLAGCFGRPFEGLSLRHPAGLPGGRMKLADRVLELDPAGGRFGMGVIRAEMDIYPDDWFLTCHFVDDRVMPGTLMYECCLHTFRIFLSRMGWVGEAGRIVYEPVPGIASRLKCRGQVKESTEKVVYEVVVKELGYNPSPYAIGDALMYADGKPVVEITNLSIQISGLTLEELRRTWGRSSGAAGSGRPLYDEASIRAFAVGKPSEAFGEPYRVFDQDRVIARLPGPPYQFLDRVVEVHADAWKMVPGGTIEAEYDVPPDAWYFQAERHGRMPFAVLLEVALQPCGWFAAYMGSALTSDIDLHFRNLGGSAVQFEAIGPDAGTLSTRVKVTNVSHSGGMIIQNYTFEVRRGNALVYKGDTYFGFFSTDALSQQVGIRDAALYEPTPAELSVSAELAYPVEAPYPDDMLRMVDRIDVFDPKGGPHGLGFIRGGIDVDSAAWFFKAHFLQDPVWPGSLGLEAFVQLLKHVAVERWGVGPKPCLEALVPDCKHEWVYRGQVIPTDKRVTIEATITAADDDEQIIRGNGFLSVDGRTIYSMTDFAVRLSEPGIGNTGA